MRIAHIGLACFFTEGMTYQDNYLSHINALDGNEVLYVSNAEKYENGDLVPTGYEDKTLPDGVRLVRLPYVHVLNGFVSDKFRKVKGLYALLEDFAPDVILSHDLCYWSVLDVIRYKKEHPQVKLYADTHTAAYNSGTNWLSLYILHRMFYRHLTQKALPYLEKYFYIGEGEREFSIGVYGVPESLMEFYPLGGTLLSDEEYAAMRAKRRTELGLGEDDRLYVHSGKLAALKRTDELLRAFSAVDDPHAVLAVIGSIPKEREAVLLPLIAADKRIRYLGWKTGEELQEYLCAADLYCQPGSQSATMQNALCRYCPVMLYPHPSYTVGYDRGEVLWVKTQADVETVFRSLAATPAQLTPLRENAEKFAREVLDYRKLAARLYR